MWIWRLSAETLTCSLSNLCCSVSLANWEGERRLIKKKKKKKKKKELAQEGSGLRGDKGDCERGEAPTTDQLFRSVTT